jgi:hypothetical protein
MSPRGGYRPDSGQPPIGGVPQTERIGLKLTEGERAEIEAAIPDGHPVGRWIVEAALTRARHQERNQAMTRKLQPVAAADTLHDRIRKLHCVMCRSGEPKATPCPCSCHLARKVTP